MKRKFIAYWFITILFEITSAAVFRFTFGDVHARAPYLIYEVSETTEIPLQVLEIRMPVPHTRKVVYVIVEIVCAGIPPTVKFDWSRNKVIIRYDWFQVQEIYKYRVSASGVAVHYGSLETEEVTTKEVPEVYE